MNRRVIVAGVAVCAFVLICGAVVYQSFWGSDASAVRTAGTSETVSGQSTGYQTASEDQLGAPFVRSHSPILGPKEAPVTITEFFDPACEACRAFHPYIKQIMEAFPEKVRVVVRYAAFHKQSREAIQVLEAARKQDKFSPVLEALLKAQPLWAPHGRTGKSLWNFVSETGLDVERARKDAKDPEVVSAIQLDREDIGTLKVRGTPTFFVNGKPLQKFGPQQLYNMVKAEVDALG